MSVQILIGDVRDRLKGLPDESVHCVVTSPPYWGLRDYGVAGQLGLERTLGEHVSTMVEVFREVRRVLRKDGTLWLNYGDSYATSMNGRSAADTKAAGNDDRTFRDKPFSTIGPIYDPDGGQVPDSKNPKARAGATDNKGNKGADFGGRIRAGGFLKPKDLCGIPWRVAFALQDDGWWLRQDIIWSKPNPMPESIRDRCTKAHEYLFLMAKSERYFYDADAIRESISSSTLTRWGGIPDKKRPDGLPTDAYVAGENTCGANPDGRNKRSVWEVATSPFSEAHFATFPPALIEPCIKAGCPDGGTVLDPFGGAGTTGLVADRLRRNAILIELNPEYAAMARKRIDGDGPLFAGTEHEPPYNGQQDLSRGLDAAYEAIRERKAAGGPGWVPSK